MLHIVEIKTQDIHYLLMACMIDYLETLRILLKFECKLENVVRELLLKYQQ